MGDQAKIGAILSYVAIAFNTVAGLLYTPWMVVTIGASDYGLYTLAMSIINFFLLDFGLGNAVSRFLSKYYAMGDREKANLFLGIVYKIYALLATCLAVIFVVIFLSIDSIYANLTVEQLPIFKGLFAIAACYSVLSFSFISFDGILVSNEKFIALNIINLVQKVLTVALIIVALILGMGVYALVAINAIVGAAAIISKLLFIRCKTDARPKLTFFDKGFAKEILGFSAWVMISQLCQRFIFSVMPTILAMFSNASEIAIFGLAVSLEGYVWTVANALNGLMMPGVSRVLESGDRSRLQSLMEKIGRIQVYVIGLIVLGFVSLGDCFVLNWVGPDFDALYICTVLLIVPSLLELPQLVAGTAIVASGEVKAKAFVFVAMAVINVALSIPLASMFGAPGACFSIFIAYCSRTAGMSFLYVKKLGVRMGSFFMRTYSSWLFPAALALATGFLSKAIVPLAGWLHFAVCARVVCFVYCITCFVFSFNSYEKGLVRGIVGKVK